MMPVDLAGMSPEALDLPAITTRLDADGHVVLPGLLSPDGVDRLREQVIGAAAARESPPCGHDDDGARPAPWHVDLPASLAGWTAGMYRRLVALADRWNTRMGLDDRFPATLDAFREAGRRAGQTRPLSRLHILETSQRVALHRQDEGTHVFPLQLIALLSRPGAEFTGGEVVVTEQRPRMQSRPSVLPLGIGDVAIIATGIRPCRGSRGDYRVIHRHAISRVRDGRRIGLVISFHDAPADAVTTG